MSSGRWGYGQGAAACLPPVGIAIIAGYKLFLTAARGLRCVQQHIVPPSPAEPLAGAGICPKARRDGRVGLYRQKGWAEAELLSCSHQWPAEPSTVPGLSRGPHTTKLQPRHLRLNCSRLNFWWVSNDCKNSPLALGAITIYEVDL